MHNPHLPHAALWLSMAFLLAACLFPPPPLATQPALQTDKEATTLTLIPTSVAPSVVQDNTIEQSDNVTDAQRQLLAGLPNLGVAPELQNTTWFNSDPLQLTTLRGKVVMVEFWTYGCINCRNVIPSVKEWHEKYADDGLVIIGVHTPEFTHEKDLANVEAAIAQLGVTWPVVIDNDKLTWRAYANHYWPAAYLIDKKGQIRLLKIGEGQYDYVESVIQALLAEAL